MFVLIKHTLKLFLAVLPALILIAGCENNKAELLYPPVTCDTAAVTYRGTISPIISANCSSCHSGINPAHGIDLTLYSVVKEHVNNGELWAVINHQAGYPAMPRNNDKLSDCTITKFKIWILAGAPDN